MWSYSMIWLLARPLSPSPVSKLSLSLSLPVGYIAGQAYEREREGESERGALSYDRKKAWHSINHSLLSGIVTLRTPQESAYVVRSKGLRVAHLPSPKVLFFSLANMW
jgi:hypothetical protein